MFTSPPAAKRELKTERLSADLVVVGGGLSGVCCAITAARAGVKVVLVQDRPVLGGNGSSEVRLWCLGATSHMGNNNRWAREGGVIDELLVENMFRNAPGNPLIFDALLLEKVAVEPNITLLLNTAVFEAEKWLGHPAQDSPANSQNSWAGSPSHSAASDTIKSVRAYCSQNETLYDIHAPLFCDASGDGVLGFLAGAAFRMGCEAASEFDEKFAPPQPTNELLGHTIYFYSKDAGQPVVFVPPSFALTDITKIPRWRDIKAGDFGCRFWWLEWGGTLDTIHETERIKWELWKVVYGVWNHIKNSGQFPEAANYTLEWVGTIPGKRESRRFEGDYILSQRDIIEQRQHADAVSFGGWAIDLHPAEGVYSPLPGCTQWHSKGVYQIPYRCLYSRNIKNLFLGGRLISVSHIAFGSTRVMCTGAHNGQAVGMAAAQRVLPAQVDVARLQQDLVRAGQYIPGVRLKWLGHPAQESKQSMGKMPMPHFRASSELKLAGFKPNGETLPLRQPWAMMLPVQAGPMPTIGVTLDVAQPTTLRAELRISSKLDNHTPDVTLAKVELPLVAGKNQPVHLKFAAQIDQPRYAFVCLMANEHVAVHLSDQRVTGVLAVMHNGNKAVAKSATQTPPPDIGIDMFEFWTPQRRPGGKNFALTIDPPLAAFGAANLGNGFARPTNQPNAWVADLEDRSPTVTVRFDQPQTVGRIELGFDADYDHPMESALLGHPERVMPFCVKRYRLRDGAGNLLAECADNHQTRNTIVLASAITTDRLVLECLETHGQTPPAVMELRCYAC